MLALILTAASRAGAQEATWVEVARVADSAIFLDSASIHPVKGGLLEARSKREYYTPRHYRSDTYNLVLSQARIDCKNQSEMGLSSEYYMGKTLVQRFFSTAARRHWSPHRPGNYTDMAIAMACRIAESRKASPGAQP